MNRRNFLQLGKIGVGVVFVFIWGKLILVNNKLKQGRVRKYLFNKNKKVSFYDEYIVVNQNGETTVFNAHCTHLGCTINNVENEVLVCPCHGSQFSLDGKPIKGPAFKPLEKMLAKISPDGKHIEITS